MYVYIFLIQRNNIFLRLQLYHSHSSNYIYITTFICLCTMYEYKFKKSEIVLNCNINIHNTSKKISHLCIVLLVTLARKMLLVMSRCNICVYIHYAILLFLFSCSERKHKVREKLFMI